jgi:Ca2+/Na+ antiporter
MDIPVNLGGSLTILFFVGFGIFFYPWVLKRRGGVAVVAALTVLLAVLFYVFDDPRGVETTTSAGLAVLWALFPAVIGVIVKRIQTKGVSSS